MLTFFFLFHAADVAVALRNSEREEDGDECSTCCRECEFCHSILR